MKPILIGESNPFGNGPEYDLWPEPAHCSGGRLAKILNLSKTEYVRTFDRMNLCRDAWSMKTASAVAKQLVLLSISQGGRHIILLGAKVCSAFNVSYKPFNAIQVQNCCLIVFPHPSGRNRRWNDPSYPRRARNIVSDIIEKD